VHDVAFLVVAFIDKVLLGVNTVLGKGGGALYKQYKAIKARQTISSMLYSGPYGIYRIRKPFNKESVSYDNIK
jgi:hypothetical protein